MDEDLYSDLLIDLPRGQHSEHVGQAPHNYFEHPANIAATESMRMDVRNNRESKLFLGVVGGKVVTGKRLPDGRIPRWVQGGVPIGVADDRHHGLIAGSRGGKSRSFLMANLIAAPRETSIVTIDPKGELAAATATYRAKILGQETAVLDCFGCSGDSTLRYRRKLNPIETLLGTGQTTIAADAMQISDALVVENQSVKDPHWDDGSREFISGLCVHVATHPNYEGRRDLVTVWELAIAANQPDPNDAHAFALETEMLESDAGGGYVRGCATAFYSRTGDEFSSMTSTVRRHLSFIAVDAVRDILRGESIDPRQVKNGSLALYICIPAMRERLMRGFKRLCIQTCLAACENEQTMFGHQALFLLDEFHGLGKLDCIETAIAQFAGLGVKLVVILQDLSQIQALYPKSWQTFMGNVGTLQTFAGFDEVTLNYLSKRLGEAITATTSSQRPSREQMVNDASSGLNWSIGTKPLMAPNEIERYFARDDPKLRQLVLRPGYRPMILQRCFYDKSEHFSMELS
ncbi:type IV secretory system conjugative DNA transfer family protein [Stieleria sp. TO1_6]|uniref:type IV secretory system conjugative DNA transfer family protein n=1 Tax=Stieleria tagensis TaxID=2956795 RepID=UPI00209A9F0C|nr:type IV secretory system conjugative DNA transfer family protein [Stieleria tagensis]MCO8125190.1 type IV secretory system conjugative DNA transfer family protein [Stieleria tagensis]